MPLENPNIAPQNPQAHDIELSIVMPCLNEAETLATCIKKAQTFLRQEQISGEIIIADNGSTDGSLQIAIDSGTRLVKVATRGYGAALYAGCQAACGRFIIMGDADDSYDFSQLQPYLEKLRQGYDLVMGNRFQGGIKKGAMPWKNRFIGNPILSMLGRIFFSSAIGDFHCGLRGFSKNAFERMQLKSTGMEFASEIVISATLKSMKICEVPTTLSPDGRSRPPHLRPWRDGWRHLRFMLLFSPRWLFLYPGTMLFVLGGLLFPALYCGPLHLGIVTLDIHSLVFAMTAMVVGFQWMSFAIFSYLAADQAGYVTRAGGYEMRLLKLFHLESGLLLGTAMSAVGVFLAFASVSFWGRAWGFGDIAGHELLRRVLLSALLLSLGVQVMLTCFLLGAMTFKKN